MSQPRLALLKQQVLELKTPKLQVLVIVLAVLVYNYESLR